MFPTKNLALEPGELETGTLPGDRAEVRPGNRKEHTAKDSLQFGLGVSTYRKGMRDSAMVLVLQVCVGEELAEGGPYGSASNELEGSHNQSRPHQGTLRLLARISEPSHQDTAARAEVEALLALVKRTSHVTGTARDARNRSCLGSVFCRR
jgi:hypothetical protein